MHHDEIDQSLYYIANLVENADKEYPTITSLVIFAHTFQLCEVVLFASTSFRDFHEKRLTIYEQRIVYEKLHGIYKKAFSKALQINSKSQKLINLLQEFIKSEEIDEYSNLKDEFQQDNNMNDTSDKENNTLVPLLQNPKQHCGKGRPPAGTKRFKLTHEVPKFLLLPLSKIIYCY
ncbi:hypothetical protein C1646_665062 [Rhizophagus diaphanus]|nr:hypothetical protein C1646_665062 [Rhizophagus diaphanus] [Rhizophagus sp. MUCL 43196]